MSERDTYNDLADFGKTLLGHKELDGGLVVISGFLKKLTGAMRCSIFVYDNETFELWTILANGSEKIVVPANQGLVGQIFLKNKEMIENDVAGNPHFLREVDMESGYHTVNMLGCPIHDSNNKTIGVLQLINKTDDFTDKDMQFIKVILRFISSFIEVSMAYNKP